MEKLEVTPAVQRKFTKVSKERAAILFSVGHKMKKTSDSSEVLK
jgi:hypothetical protein